MDFYALSHPIDTDKFPSIPAGWRWAVYTTDNFADIDHCLGAGWAESAEDAWHIANQASVVGVRTLLAMGRQMFSRTDVVLDFDPIPAGADFTKEA